MFVKITQRNSSDNVTMTTRMFGISFVIMFFYLSVTFIGINGQGFTTAPVDVMVSTLGDDDVYTADIKVTWKPPLQVNGSIHGYTVMYTLTDKSDSNHTLSNRSQATSADIHDLLFYTNYTIYVRAQTNLGNGEWSSPVIFWTREGTPNDVCKVTKIYSPTPTTVFISWKELPPENHRGILLNFIVFWVPVGVTDYLANYKRRTLPLSVRNFTVTDLIPFSSYYVLVIARNGANFYITPAMLNKVTVVTTMEDVPSRPPSNLKSQFICSRYELEMSWTALPDNYTNGILRRYEALLYQGEALYKNASVTSQNTTSLVLLDECRNYTVVLSAVTTPGAGPNITKNVISSCPCGPPQPLHSKRIIIAGENQSFTLPCEYRGRPEPTIYWIRNGQRLYGNTKYFNISEFNGNTFGTHINRVSKQLTNGSWYVSHAELQDSGNYACVLNSSFGLATSNVTLSVAKDVVTVKFGLMLMNKTFHKDLRNSRSEMFIKLSSYITPQILQLFRDSDKRFSVKVIEVLQFRKGSIIADMEAFATVDDPTFKDNAGDMIKSKLVQVLSGSKSSLGNLSVSTLVIEGSYLSTSATALSWTTTASVPKTETTAQPTTTIVTMTTQTLNHTGSNLSTSATALSLTTTASVPKTVTINKTIDVDSGNSQLLPCDSSVHSPDTFKWKRGGEFLSPDKSRIIQLSNGSLLVRNVSTIDSGYYLCVADDKILYNVTINVKVKVEVQMELRITNVEYTEDFQNKSSVAYVEFERNFTTAMDTLYNKTEGYKKTIILNIRNGSTKVDFKVIIVRVVKKPGRKEPEIKVEVTGKIITTITKSNGYIKSLRVDTDPKTLQLKVEPPVPKEPKMEEVKATSVVIAWSEPENHQYYNIKGYIVGLRKFGSGNEWLNESVEGTGTRKYSVRNLEPETQYYVNVAAQNKYGRGVATEPKALTTEKAGLAGWAVAIIVVLLLVLVAVAVAVFWYRKKRIAREERRRINYLEMAEKEKEAKFNPYDDKGRLESWNVGFSEVDCSCLKIPWDHLELSKLLGSGAFGEVYKGQVVLEGDRTVECAVKTVKDNATEEEKRDLYKELEIMSTVGSHPNLVNLIGASMKGDKLYIAIEFAAKGCLLDYLRDNRVVKDGGKETDTSQVDTNTKLMLALDVANGMAYLATKRCIHRDLAARNVLLTENCRGKVADFGMSRDIYSEGVYEKKTAGKLPIRWMALEAIETFMFTAETDVWSYGVLLWEIETAGVTPWGGLNAKEIVNALKSGKRLERPEGCAQEIYEIMLSCWKADPKARPSFKNLAERFEKLLDGKQETEDEKRKDASIC